MTRIVVDIPPHQLTRLSQRHDEDLETLVQEGLALRDELVGVEEVLPECRERAGLGDASDD